MVLSKIIVLFIFGIVFCVASSIATILCGIGTLEVYGIGYKLFLAVETGIETVDRLIQNQKFRIVNNGKGDGKPLLHTKRIL